MSAVTVLPDPMKYCHWKLAPGIENVFHRECGGAILPMKPYPKKCDHCNRPIYSPEMKR